MRPTLLEGLPEWTAFRTTTVKSGHENLTLARPRRPSTTLTSPRSDDKKYHKPKYNKVSQPRLISTNPDIYKQSNNEANNKFKVPSKSREKHESKRDRLRLKSYDIKYMDKYENYPDDLKSAESSDESFINNSQRSNFKARPCGFTHNLWDEVHPTIGCTDYSRLLNTTLERSIGDVYLKDTAETRSTTSGKRRSDTKQRQDRVSVAHKPSATSIGNVPLPQHKNKYSPTNDRSQLKVNKVRSAQTQNISDANRNTNLARNRSREWATESKGSICPLQPHERQKAVSNFTDLYTPIFCRATNSAYDPNAKNATNADIKETKSVTKLTHHEHLLKDKINKNTKKHLVLTDSNTNNSPSIALTGNEHTEGHKVLKSNTPSTHARKDIKHHFKENITHTGLLPTIPEGRASKDEYVTLNTSLRFLTWREALLSYEERPMNAIIKRNSIKNSDENDTISWRNVVDKTGSTQWKKKQSSSNYSKNTRGTNLSTKVMTSSFPPELKNASESDSDETLLNHFQIHPPTQTTYRKENRLHSAKRLLNLNLLKSGSSIEVFPWYDAGKRIDPLRVSRFQKKRLK